MFFRVCLFLGLGLLNATIFFFMIWGSNGLIAYHELKHQLAKLESQKAEIEEKSLQLSHEIRLLKTDRNYQEKMIREKLRYIRNNEIVYIFDANS